MTGYTLQCFGGAGGQHACLVADAWGMGQVFIHPLAGVLSAFGMGLAEIPALREVQFDAPLTDAGATAALALIAAEARAEVTAQGVMQVRGEALAHLRQDGSHQPPAFGEPAAMHSAPGVLAASQGTVNNFVSENNRFQNYETIAGGSGAGLCGL